MATSFFLMFIVLFVPSLTAFSIDVSSDIKLRFSPLFGGPSWLPVHCQVILYGEFGFDFVPINPASSETLQRLLTLQAVPAEARILPSKTLTMNHGESLVLKAEEFCSQYDKNLHLITNNCWAFSYDMIKYILDDEER
jgi:hypothetical protein